MPQSPLTSKQGREPKVTMTCALIDTKLRKSRRNIWIRIGVLAGVTALIFALWYGLLGLAVYLSGGQSRLSHRLELVIVICPCPRDVPESLSTANDRHLQSANMKPGQALNPRATHENTLTRASSSTPRHGRAPRPPARHWPGHPGPSPGSRRPSSGPRTRPRSVRRHTGPG